MAPLHEEFPWSRKTPKRGESSFLLGLHLVADFPDQRRVLETAYADFARFTASLNLPEARNANIFLKPNPSLSAEEHVIQVNAQKVTISAADTEGVRRALVWIEDEMLKRGGPFLPRGAYRRRPVIRTRISRCFFGPINRPPLNRDELNDEIDYYPEPYLNRLAHEGVNALWVTIRFQDTVPSKLFPSFAPNSAHRLAKLCHTVERCARYGIRIFVFCIEPDSLPLDSPLLRRHPELKGHVIDFRAAFCTSTPLGRAYLEEAGQTLFEKVPGLGGIIVIPVGERFTQCSSIALPESGRTTESCNCPRCSRKSPYQVLGQTLSSLRRGLDRVDRSAELIAWPYGQLIMWGDEMTEESARHIPRGVVLQHNFELGATNRQLGKDRPLCDYWLSVVGPGATFARAAKAARSQGTRVSAKLQVGCSHEIATVPFVPVPGLLQAKYREMHRLGVSSAMQSWFFGNYPSLMTRAAGLLSFAPFPADEGEFLQDLAARDWQEAAPSVVAAWKLFRRAYENYPSTHLFGYYGPVQDGVVWPLYLIPRNLPLCPTWKIDYRVSGDYLADCLSSEFTLDEIATLCSRMAGLWKKGLVPLKKAFDTSAQSRAQRQQWSVAEAVGLQFESGSEIIRFYQLRERLTQVSDHQAGTLLDEMEALVRREIARRQHMIALCRAEPSLGYHSEAEGYKVTPALIRRGIRALERLLATEFTLVRGAMQKREFLFGNYTGVRPTSALLRLRHESKSRAVEPEWMPLSHVLTRARGKDSRVIPGTEWRRARLAEIPLRVRFHAAVQRSGLHIVVDVQELPSKRSSLLSESWIATTIVDIEPARLRPRIQFSSDSQGVTSTMVDDGYLMPAQLPFEHEWRARPTGREVDLFIPFQSARLPARAARFRCNLRMVFFNRETDERHELSWMRRSPLKPRQAWDDAHPGKDYGWVFLPRRS